MHIFFSNILRRKGEAEKLESVLLASECGYETKIIEHMIGVMDCVKIGDASTKEGERR